MLSQDEMTRKSNEENTLLIMIKNESHTCYVLFAKKERLANLGGSIRD